MDGLKKQPNMRRIIIFCGIAIVLGIFPANGFSQDMGSTAARTSASIIDQGSISRSIPTDFGSMTLVLSAYIKVAPVNPKATKGSIVLPVSSGTFTAAVFNYTATSGSTYTVSYPMAPIIIRSGSEELKITSFTSDPPQNSGSEVIAGVFVSVSPMSVIVNYN